MLDCANLPEKKDHQTLCMEAPSGGLADEIFGQEGTGYGTADLPPSAAGNHPDWVKLMEEFRRGDATFKGNTGTGAVGSSSNSNAKDRSRGGGGGGGEGWRDNTALVSPASTLCGDRFVPVERLQDRGPDGYCAPRCDMEVLFREKDKRFAFVWTTVWAGCSLFAAILTVLTFCVDTSRFPYPERPIIFLAMCFIPLSVAYLLRVVVSAETLSCDRTVAAAAKDASLDGSDGMIEPTSGPLFIVQDGMGNTWCIVVFVLVYYFQMASALWWLTLSVTWFLAAARKWGAEAIARLGCYFHIVAWTVPAVQTVVVLALRRVDGDELLGTCYVGNRSGPSRMALVILPLLAYLALGSIFILAGFVAMLRIRADLRRHEPMLAQQQQQTCTGGSGGGGCPGSIRKLEKLMAKIGLFAVLYAVPAACVVAAHFYEHVYQSDWLRAARHTPCTASQPSPQLQQQAVDNGSPLSDGSETIAGGDEQCQPLGRSYPSVEVFMLRHFMTLVVGITSGMWVWSAKTCRTWSKFCSSSSSGATSGSSSRSSAAGKRKSPAVARSSMATATAATGGAGAPAGVTGSGGGGGVMLGGFRTSSMKAAFTSDPSPGYLKSAPTVPITGLPSVHHSPADRAKLTSRI